jgi:hypothetical protein
MRLERLRQARDTGRKRFGGSAGNHQASPDRGRVFRSQLVNQVQAALCAEMSIHQHCVVFVWAQTACLGQRGGDIDGIAAAAECAADQSPHLIEVIHDKDPCASSHCATLPVSLFRRPASPKLPTQPDSRHL